MSGLVDAGGLPAGWVLTLPKVTSAEQVAAFADLCATWEAGADVEPGTVRFEIQVETPQAILGPDGVATVAPMLRAGAGRVTGLHYGTYASEVYRAGIDNVPRGQWEAAKACNLSARQTWMHVILPQAIPPMIPALANYFVAMFKETPLLSAITVLELMNQAKSVANTYYRYVEPMTLIGAFFLVISLFSVILLRWLERRYGRIER